MSTTLYNDPHFIKPLFPGFEHDLGEKGEIATLRSRREGKLWPVKINGGQFRGGWKQFVHDHDLQIGDCLLFRHEGNLVSYVLVFGHNTCEREYPPSIEIQEQNLPDSSIDSPFTVTKEEQLEIQEQNLPDSSSDPSFTALEEEPTETEEHNLARDFRSVHPLVTASVGESIEDEEQNLSSCSIGGSKLERNMKRKNVFEAKASSSGSKHPSCEVMVTPDSIKDNRLNIPWNFVAACGLNPILRTYSIILEDENSDYYRTVILSYDSSDKKFYIEGDWTSYHIVHKLKAGDSLMIEFFKDGETPVFKLTMQEHPELTREPTCQNSSDESEISKKHKPFEKAFEARHYCRVKTLTGNKPQLYIALFRWWHLLNAEVILRDREGRSLPAELTYSQVTIRIADDWRKFAAANDFKVGDKLVIEFVENRERPIFKIYGFRAFTGKSRKSASDSPHYFVVMQDCFKKHRRRIPIDIARKYRDAVKKCSKLTITNELGKSWEVPVSSNRFGVYYMRSGWIKFVKENRIGEGDLFMLELVKGGDVPQLKYYEVRDINHEGFSEDCEDVEPKK